MMIFKYYQFNSDFFERRETHDGTIHWPSIEVVQRIIELGCHVVPKPSKKELRCFQPGTCFLSEYDDNSI